MMRNDLVNLSDAEREVLIVWNIDQMATARARAESMLHWKRAQLLIRGRSVAAQMKVDRALGRSPSAVAVTA